MTSLPEKSLSLRKQLSDGGILLVDKPRGLSSFGVIEAIQSALTKAWNCKRGDLPKMGHGGTLDPFATGLLLVCVGRAVKLSQYFLESIKSYSGVMEIGNRTETGDLDGKIVETRPVLLTGADLRAKLTSAAHAFTTGPYLQTPPMYSAKKKDGVPLYELARKGITVDRKPKECLVSRFEILSLEQDEGAGTGETAGGFPRVTFESVVTSGTYIRVLAEDLAEKLGTVAHLKELRRLGSGAFRIENAVTVDALKAAITSDAAIASFLPFDRALAHYPSILSTPDETMALRQGKQSVVSQVQAKLAADQSLTKDSKLLVVYDGATQALVALFRKHQNQFELERVFNVDQN